MEIGVDEEVIELIAAVRRIPLLWDPANPGYHKLDVREQTWLQLSNQLDVPCSRLKRKWKYLREHFLVQLKRTHLRKGKRYFKPWKYYSYLQFLKKAIKEEYLPNGIDSESENPKDTANENPSKSQSLLMAGSSMKIEKGKHYEIVEETWSEAEADKTDTTSERNGNDDDGDNDDDDNDDDDDEGVGDNTVEAEDDMEFLEFDDTIDETIPLSAQIDAIMKEMAAMPKPIKEKGKPEKEAKGIENGNCNEKTRRAAKNSPPIKVADLKKLQSTDVATEAKSEKSKSITATKSSEAFDNCTETDQSILYLRSLVPYLQQMDFVQQMRVRNKFQDVIMSEITKLKERP